MTEYDVVVKHTTSAVDDGVIEEMDIPDDAIGINTQTATTAPTIVAVTYLVPSGD